MSKAASLTSGLVARKGQAMPAVVAEVPPAAVAADEPVTAQAAQVVQEVQPAKATTGTAYYKALTVKLDRARYEALKGAGIRLDKKSQEIFVEALDAYLAKMG